MRLKPKALFAFFPPLFLLLLLGGACAGGDPVALTPTSGAAATSGPTQPAEVVPESTPTAQSGANPEPLLATPKARPFPNDLQQEADAILDRLVSVRGLAPTGEIGMNLIGRPETIDFYRATTTEEDREAVRVQQEIYGLLGLIPEDTDILAFFLDLLDLGIAGFYDSDLKAFYLLDDLGGLASHASQQTIVHELTHALQDQYYDLTALFEEREKDWDAATALASLIEGDAVAAETAYFGDALRSRPSCFTIPAFRRSSPPYVIVRELNSRYDDGLCFVEAVLAQLGGDLDALFNDPPVSTEQILHPEKYLTGEEPIAVSLPSIGSALGDGWSRTETSTFGEFSLQNLLILGLPNDRSKIQNATAGWGGDSWEFFESTSDRKFLQATIVWDSDEDKEEFWDAFLESLENRDPEESDLAGTKEFRAVIDGNTWLVAVETNSVIILVTDDPSAMGRVAKSVGFD